MWSHVRPGLWSLPLLALVACGTDSGADCTTTYRHIIDLAHRNHDPALMADFVTACVEHYDPERLACIRAASTPGAALVCKPQKKRPD